jgi:hypothetical protein
VRGSIARKIAVPQFPRQRQIKRKKKKKKRKKKKRKKKKGKNTDQPQAGVAASNIGSRGASAVMIESPQEGGKRAREGEPLPRGFLAAETGINRSLPRAFSE